MKRAKSFFTPGVVLIGLLCLLAGPALKAQSQLIGANLQVGYYYPNPSSLFYSSTIFTVGTGVELASYMNNPSFSIDVTGSTIRIYNFQNYSGFPGPASFSPATFNGLIFSDFGNSLPAFSSVTVDISSTLSGFDNSRVSFNADSINLNLQGLTYDNSRQVVLNVAVVPEPSTLAIISLAGIAVLLRRKA